MDSQAIFEFDVVREAISGVCADLPGQLSPFFGDFGGMVVSLVCTIVNAALDLAGGILANLTAA